MTFLGHKNHVKLIIYIGGITPEDTLKWIKIDTVEGKNNYLYSTGVIK